MADGQHPNLKGPGSAPAPRNAAGFLLCAQILDRTTKRGRRRCAVEKSLRGVAHKVESFYEHSYGDLSTWPQALMDLGFDITVARLPHNRLVSIPDDIPYALPDLEELDLSDNAIEVLPPDMGGFFHLERLYLDGNCLSRLSRRVLSKLPLVELGLSRNKIQTLPDLRMSHLRVLDLSYNNLQDIPSEVLTFAPRLEELYLNDNGIATIPYEISELLYLRVLCLENNSISLLPYDIEDCRRLQVLTLANNLLTNVPPTIGSLVRLRVLTLSGNQIMGLPDEICFLKSLESLELARNNLMQLPGSIGLLTELVELDISSNRLEHLPPALASLPRLERFYATGNESLAGEFPQEVLTSVRHLRTALQATPADVPGAHRANQRPGDFFRQALHRAAQKKRKENINQALYGAAEGAPGSPSPLNRSRSRSRTHQGAVGDGGREFQRLAGGGSPRGQRVSDTGASTPPKPRRSSKGGAGAASDGSGQGGRSPRGSALGVLGATGNGSFTDTVASVPESSGGRSPRVSFTVLEDGDNTHRPTLPGRSPRVSFGGLGDAPDGGSTPGGAPRRLSRASTLGLSRASHASSSRSLAGGADDSAHAPPTPTDSGLHGLPVSGIGRRPVGDALWTDSRRKSGAGGFPGSFLLANTEEGRRVEMTELLERARRRSDGSGLRKSSDTGGADTEEGVGQEEGEGRKRLGSKSESGAVERTLGFERGEEGGVGAGEMGLLAGVGGFAQRASRDRRASIGGPLLRRPEGISGAASERERRSSEGGSQTRRRDGSGNGAPSRQRHVSGGGALVRIEGIEGRRVSEDARTSTEGRSTVVAGGEERERRRRVSLGGVRLAAEGERMSRGEAQSESARSRRASHGGFSVRSGGEDGGRKVEEEDEGEGGEGGEDKGRGWEEVGYDRARQWGVVGEKAGEREGESRQPTRATQVGYGKDDAAAKEDEDEEPLLLSLSERLAVPSEDNSADPASPSATSRLRCASMGANAGGQTQSPPVARAGSSENWIHASRTLVPGAHLDHLLPDGGLSKHRTSRLGGSVGERGPKGAGSVPRGASGAMRAPWRSGGSRASASSSQRSLLRGAGRGSEGQSSDAGIHKPHARLLFPSVSIPRRASSRREGERESGERCGEGGLGDGVLLEDSYKGRPARTGDWDADGEGLMASGAENLGWRREGVWGGGGRGGDDTRAIARGSEDTVGSDGKRVSLSWRPLDGLGGVLAERMEDPDLIKQRARAAEAEASRMHAGGELGGGSGRGRGRAGGGAGKIGDHSRPVIPDGRASVELPVLSPRSMRVGQLHPHPVDSPARRAGARYEGWPDSSWRRGAGGSLAGHSNEGSPPVLHGTRTHSFEVAAPRLALPGATGTLSHSPGVETHSAVPWAPTAPRLDASLATMPAGVHLRDETPFGGEVFLRGRHPARPAATGLPDKSGVRASERGSVGRYPWEVLPRRYSRKKIVVDK